MSKRAAPKSNAAIESAISAAAAKFGAKIAIRFGTRVMIFHPAGANQVAAHKAAKGLPHFDLVETYGPRCGEGIISRGTVVG